MPLATPSAFEGWPRTQPIAGGPGLGPEDTGSRPTAAAAGKSAEEFARRDEGVDIAGRNAPGRPKGRRSGPAARHPAIKKTNKQAKKAA